VTDAFPAGSVSVIAELGPNHNGSLQNVFYLIDAAAEAGADWIKLQAYTADELVALRGDGKAPPPWGDDGWQMRDLYTHAATPFDWFPTIKNYCESRSINWFASVFGKTSLDMLESCDCPVYKIAAMESQNAHLRAMIGSTDKPLVVSSPHPNVFAAHPRLLMCYCPPSYPQTRFCLRNLRNGYEGFSYHHNDPNLPALTVPFGVRYIEAHIHLEDEPSRFEAGFAMAPDVFGQMIERIRQAEAACAAS